MSILKEINEIILVKNFALELLKEEDYSSEIPKNTGNETGSYTIPMYDYDSFMSTLEKINKKAQKYGIKPLTIKNKEKIVYKKEIPSEGKPAIMAWKIDLQGEPVRINGWKFIAKVDHTPENGNNILTFVPGNFNPEVKKFVNASNRNCDFCHSNRDRNNTYIIQNDSGELKQIGGQCLQKYIGDAARQLAKFSFSMHNILDELEDNEDEGGFKGGNRKVIVDVQTALASAITITDKYGFVKSSSSENGEITTKKLLEFALFYHGNLDKDLPKEFHQIVRDASFPTAETRKRADEIINWMKTLPEEQKSSSYMLSLESIFDADMVSQKSTGIIASVPTVYSSNIKKKNNLVSSGEYIGSVGAKIPETTVTAIYSKIFEGTYGSYQMVKFKDDADNNYIWFNTSKVDIKEGKKYNIIGTIKKHDEFKGIKQTVLTRVKASEI